MASWVGVWDFLTRGHSVMEIGGLNPRHDTIVGGNWQGFIYRICQIL